MNFIEEIAKYVQTYSIAYGIQVCSPIIAQAILESDSGTSELAVNAHNYFGLKYKASVASEHYIKVGSEQNANGTYTSSVMKWCKFPSMEAGVKGYFDFISAQRYANLKGIKDPLTYLETIKADGYATSLRYVENVYAVLNKYNLTKYDLVEFGGTKPMRINVHAGHNPDGKIACGAVGFIKESTENRNVKNEVIRLLKALGHTVYDCTVDDGVNANDVLSKIVSKCNSHVVDLDVSIHFNAGSKDADNATTGTEVFVYAENSKAKDKAQKTCEAIEALGFKNRGVKYSKNLYVLKNTKAPAMLIECCFVDDNDDVALYDYKTMASAIVYGITGQTHHEEITQDNKTLYRVQVGAYSIRENAENMQRKLKESGFNAIIVKS